MYRRSDDSKIWPHLPGARNILARLQLKSD
jgi:hypothetical protein